MMTGGTPISGNLHIEKKKSNRILSWSDWKPIPRVRAWHLGAVFWISVAPSTKKPSWKMGIFSVYQLLPGEHKLYHLVYQCFLYMLKT